MVNAGHEYVGGMTGVGGVCEMCICLGQGSVGGEEMGG